MTFSEEYLTHLRVIQNIGMDNIEPINYEGKEIVPIQFLKAVLPDPKSLGANYKGWTSIGCRIRGVKDGEEKTLYIYNNTDHEVAYAETGTKAGSYTNRVPAMIGAKVMEEGKWIKPGGGNIENCDADPGKEERKQNDMK